LIGTAYGPRDQVGAEELVAVLAADFKVSSAMQPYLRKGKRALFGPVPASPEMDLIIRQISESLAP